MAKDVKQDVELGITKPATQYEEARRGVLELSTYKGNRGIVSNVTVFWVGDRCRSTMLFGDFSKTVRTVPGTATQKALDAAHRMAFTPEVVGVLVEDAKAHSLKRMDAGE